MNTRILALLDECLEMIDQGASIEACLDRFPDEAEELRPLLTAARSVKDLADERVPVATFRQSRSKFLSAAAEARESSRQPARRPFQQVLRFGLAVLLAVIVIGAAGGTGLVNASASTLPGDQLYGVKRGWEDLRLKFAASQDERLRLEDEYEKERVNEVKSLVSTNRSEEVRFAGRVDDAGEGWILVAGLKVLLRANTRIDDAFAPGDWVRVEGRTQPDGTIAAERIKLEPGGHSDDGSASEDEREGSGSSESVEPGEEKKGGSGNSGSGSEAAETPDPTGDLSGKQDQNSQKPIDLEGGISAASGSSFTVNGMIFNLDSRSEVRGSLMVGALVRIRAYLDDAGKLIVIRAEVQGSPSLESGSGGQNDSSGSGKNEPTRTPKPEETPKD